jgi:hypothetical protein
MALKPKSGLGLLYWGSITIMFYGVRLLASRPTPLNSGGPVFFCWGLLYKSKVPVFLILLSRLCHYSVSLVAPLFIWMVLVPCAGDSPSDRGGEWRGDYDRVNNRDRLKLTLDLTTRWATENDNFVYSSLRDFKSSFACRKILRHGTFPLYFPSEWKVCCGFLSLLKIHHLGRVLNQQPLGPMASTVTTTPQRQIPVLRPWKPAFHPTPICCTTHCALPLDHHEVAKTLGSLAEPAGWIHMKLSGI